MLPPGRPTLAWALFIGAVYLMRQCQVSSSMPVRKAREIICGRPNYVHHGRMKFTGWETGDKLTYFCEAGYMYEGINPRTCQADGSWSGQDGKCAAEHGCGEAPDIDKAEVRVLGDKRERAEVVCESGYTLSGAAILHCLASRTWTKTSRCIKTKCDDDASLDHGALEIVGRNVGDIATVTCGDFYTLVGASKIKCQEDGTWSNPGQCQENVCEDDPTIEHGTVSITGRRVADEAHIQCRAQYRLVGESTVVCQRGGHWSAPGSCTKIVCEQTPSIDQGTIAVQAHNIGDVANITCKPEYSLEGEHSVTCQADGTWSAAGKCKGKAHCPILSIQDGQLTLKGQEIGDVAIVTCQPGYSLEGPATITCLQGGIWSSPGNCTAAHERAVERWRLLHDLEAESRTKVEALLIKNLKVTLGPRIGKGHFAMVYKGRYQGRKHDKKPPIALKTLRGHPTSHGEKLTEFITEASLMKNFNHPNVLSLHGITIIRNRLYVVLPFLPNGDLKSFVVKTAFSMKLFTRLVYDVAKGMQYLAQQNFVHRDLAARNCMVDANNRAVVGDFGLTRDLYHRDYYCPSGLAKALPIKWMALETLERNVYTLMSDLWSYGVLLWEVYSEGGAPYPHVDMLDMYRYLMRGDRLQKPPHCPILVYDIACGCWQKDPSKRPNFTSIVKSLELIMQLQEGYSDEELLTMAGQPPPYADRQLLNAPATTAVIVTTATAATATTTPTPALTNTGLGTVRMPAAPATTAQTTAPTVAVKTTTANVKTAPTTAAPTASTTTVATRSAAPTTGVTVLTASSTHTPQSALVAMTPSKSTTGPSSSTSAPPTVTSAPTSHSGAPSPDSDYFTPVDPFTKLSDLMAAHNQGTLDAQGSIELLYLTEQMPSPPITE